MGKLNTRNGLSSLANSDILGQLSINGGGASIPLLVDGATNRLLTLSDTNSAADAVLAVQDSDGDLLFEVRPSGIRIGGNYQLPLADSSFANYFLKSNAAGTVSWANPFSTLTLSDITDLELSPLSTGAVNGAYLRYDSVNSEWVADGPHAGFHANRQLGTITKGTPVRRTGSGQGGGIYEMGVGSTNNDYRCVGIAFDAQDASSRLIVMTDGLIGGLDTSSYSTDDILYVSNTTGQLTATAPTSGLYQQRVARVVASDATNGVIQVTVDPNFDEAEYLENLTAESLGSLSDVTITSAASGEVLQYNGAEWENASLDTIVVVDVHNNSGADIAKGTPVYVSGEHASGKPTIALADNDGSGTYPAIGLVQDTITNGTDGNVVLSGPLLNLNTSSYTAGDALYIDSTAGALTSTRPTSATEAVQKVALVTRSHATSGSVVVMGAGRVNDIPNDVVLNDLDGVDLTTTAPTTNDVLKFDGTNWVPGTVSSSTAMEDISNTSITPANLVPGNFLLYSATGSGGVWYPANYTLPTSDGSDWQVLTARDTGNTYNDAEWQTLTLTRLGDVNTTGVANGDTLVYNSTSGDFEPGTAGGSQTLDEVLTEGNISTQDAQFGGVTVSQSDTGSSFISVNSIADGSDWSALSITSTSASPAINDYIGNLSWFGQNDAAQNVNYAKIDVQTSDVGDGVEDGVMNFHLMSGGSLTEVLELKGGSITARKPVTVIGAVSAQAATGTSNLIEAVNGDATGADWPAMAISRYTTTPADNDNVGIFQFNHMNSSIALKTFADIEVVATDITAGTEDGKMIFNIIEGGTSTQKLQLIPAGAVIDGTASADTFSLSTTDDTGQFLATRTVSVPTDWNAFEAFRYDVTYATGPIGSQAFSALNDNDETIRYARTSGVIADSTDGSEDGEWRWYAMVAGTDTQLMQLDGGGLQLGGASGFILPLTDGSANQVLQTNGSGTVSWVSAPAPSSIGDIGDVLVSSPSANQVLKWDPVDLRWENGSIPVPTLAEVTAAGASTSSTLSLASILQTGSTINVAASGNHYAQLRATTLEVGTTSTEQYQFPASDGNAGEVLTTDGAGALSFGKARSMTFSNSGVHQLTTTTDTFYRLCSSTTAPNSTYWNRTTSSTAPSSLTRTAQHSKAGHVIPVDITAAVVNCTVSSSISASASSDTAATEYNGDTITYYLYKWADGATATQVATWTDTFNGGVSYAEEQSSATEFTLTANAGDALMLVARCLQNATATRYWSMQYTIDIQY